MQLTGLHYRAALLSIVLNGSGSHVARFLYDGKPLTQPVVPSSATGAHTIVITLQ